MKRKGGTTFIEFPGVSCPKSSVLFNCAMYVLSVSSGLSVAVPT